MSRDGARRTALRPVAISRKLPRMSFRPTRAASSGTRAFIAALLFCGVAVAVGLSAAPQLHEALHMSGAQTNHECAATLMASGNVEHSGCEPISIEAAAAPELVAFRSPARVFIVRKLGTSLLEHAPPARS